MPNMMDYLIRVSATPFTRAPWQPLDSMMMANVCYNKLGALAASHNGMTLQTLSRQIDLTPYARFPYYTERKELLMQMGASVRFGSTRACCYLDILDNARPLQFSAVTMLVPEVGVAVCFRGTDNTLTGWREDLHMSFETVPAQEAAIVYLREIARRYPGPLILVGHSKGGNLAAYAAAHTDADVQARIVRIDCFDSPGMDEATLKSEGYAAIRGRISCFVPQDSVIGLLLDNDSRTSMVVVKSTALGLRQHDCFSWQVEDDHLLTLPSTTFGSQLTDRALDEWMNRCTPEQRRICVDALFDLLDATHSPTLTDLKSNKMQSMLRILNAARALDGETMMAFLQMAGLLIQSGVTTAADMVIMDNLENLLKQVAAKTEAHPNAEPVSTVPTLRLSADTPQATQETNQTDQLLHRLSSLAHLMKKGLHSLDDLLEHSKTEHSDQGGVSL